MDTFLIKGGVHFMKVLNQIPVYPDKSVTTFRRAGRNYYVCNVCGKILNYRTISNGKAWCTKHYKQFKKYGHAIDSNPRTAYDRNEIRISGKNAEMDVYDAYGNIIDTVKFDAEDINKVRYIKWKKSNSGYIMNTPKYSGGNKHFSRVILGTDNFVDHIDHNPMNNHKDNLRIVTKSQNQMNANYKGVTKTKDGKFFAHIKKNQKMLDLGVYVDEEEALFARWYAETKLFGEYRYPKEKPEILKDRENDIMEYVDRKVQRL